MRIPPKFVILQSGCLEFKVGSGGVQNPCVGLPLNTPRKIGRKIDNCFTHTISFTLQLKIHKIKTQCTYCLNLLCSGVVV